MLFALTILFTLTPLRSVASVSSEQRLERLKAEVLRTLKTEVTPGMKEFLDNIQGLVEDIRAPILEGHESSQASITNSVQAFQECADAAGDEQAGIDILRDLSDNKSAEHVACRIAEANNTAGISACETEKARLELLKEVACAMVNATFPKCPARQETHPETDLAYLERLETYLLGKETAENTYKQECLRATDNSNSHACEHPVSAPCTTAQKALETSTCTWAAQVDSNCTSYEHCYRRKENAFYAVVAQADIDAADRKKEWQVIENMTCLIRVRLNDTSGELDHAAISVCKESNIDTVQFDLTLQALPDHLPCTAKVVKPCDDEYRNNQYVAPFASVHLLGGAVFSDMVTIGDCTECLAPAPSAPQMAEEAAQALALATANAFRDSKQNPNRASNTLLQGEFRLVSKALSTEARHVSNRAAARV